jgi:glycosyltransferase involved in cell wall biosynthesis
VRVLIVTHMWPPASRPEHMIFVRDQVDALRREPGVDVEVRRFQPGAWSYGRAALSLWRAAGRGGFQIVHAHYGLSGWSALTAGGPLVVTFHGTDLRHRVVGPLSRLLARLVSLPAAVSASLARERLPGAGARRRVMVLPCGVNLERFHQRDRRQARAALGLDPLRPYVLFAADPKRAVKRYDRALALTEALPDVELLTLQRVAPDDVPNWINAVNAVVVTSDEEGYGLAALEALACDVPVLSTPVGVAPIALTGLDGVLCAPFELERWLEALRPHVAHDDPRIAGRERAELFSTRRMAQRVLAAYREPAPASTSHQRS